jgi:hypothetical protein
MGKILELELNEAKAMGDEVSDIYVVKNTDGRDGGFQRLLELMDSNGIEFYGIVPSDSVVIVKVNSQWNERGGTNTDLVKAIVESIVSHPNGFTGEVVIADNGQAQYGSTRHGGSLDYELNNAEDKTQSNRVVAESFPGHRVSTYLWDEITSNNVGEYSEGDDGDGYVIEADADPVTGIRVSYPKFKTFHGTRISFKEGIWDSEASAYDSDKLKLINVRPTSFTGSRDASSTTWVWSAISSRAEEPTGASGPGGWGPRSPGPGPPTSTSLKRSGSTPPPGRGPGATTTRPRGSTSSWRELIPAPSTPGPPGTS